MAHPDFPIKSETTLWRQMRRLGFGYKQTHKVVVPLDSTSFIAQRAGYFRRLDNLRNDNAVVYYHDETWCNVGEEKRSIWIDDAGQGRLRKSDGKGKRLAISAMINEEGFHKDSVDLFVCDVEHSMVRMVHISSVQFRIRNCVVI